MSSWRDPAAGATPQLSRAVGVIEERLRFEVEEELVPRGGAARPDAAAADAAGAASAAIRREKEAEIAPRKKGAAAVAAAGGAGAETEGWRTPSSLSKQPGWRALSPPPRRITAEVSERRR
eukprot:gene10023-17204_t